MAVNKGIKNRICNAESKNREEKFKLLTDNLLFLRTTAVWLKDKIREMQLQSFLRRRSVGREHGCWLLWLNSFLTLVHSPDFSAHGIFQGRIGRGEQEPKIYVLSFRLRRIYERGKIHRRPLNLYPYLKLGY